MQRTLAAKKNRIWYLDIARVIAVISVSLNHAVNRSYSNYQGTQEQWEEFFTISFRSNLVRCAVMIFSRLGVPLFLMISGTLLLSRKVETEQDIGRFYKRNLLPLVITAEIWTVIMYWYIVLVNPGNTVLETGGVSGAITGMFHTMLFINQTRFGSMWYIPVIICLYLMLPLMAMVITKVGSAKPFLLPCILIFYGFMLVPAINDWLILQDAELRVGTVFNIGEEGFLGMLLYLLLGYVIGSGAFKKIPTWSLCAFFAASFAGSVWYQYYALSMPCHVLVDYSYVTVLVCAAMLFEFLRRLDRQKPSSCKLLTWLSQYAFGFYFIHIMIMETIYWCVDLSGIGRVVRMAMLEAVSLGGSLVVIAALSRIPWCRRYLFMVKE